MIPREPGILRLREQGLERLAFEHGYAALFLSPPQALDAQDGDIVLLGEERLLVVQASRTRVDYPGRISGQHSRTLLVARPLARLSVSP